MAVSTVRCRAERHLIVQAGHHVSCCAHRSRDQAALVLSRGDRAFASDPKALPEVNLLLCESVVVVDILVSHRFGTHERGQLSQCAVHHLFAVEQSEVLCSPHLGDVLVELRRTLDQFGEIRDGQVDEVLLPQILSNPDVALSSLVNHRDPPGS